MDENKQVEDLIVSKDGKLSDGVQSTQEPSIVQENNAPQEEPVVVDTMSAPIINQNDSEVSDSTTSEPDAGTEQSIPAPAMSAPVKAPDENPVDDAAEPQDSSDSSPDKRSNIGFTQSSIVSQLTPDIKSVDLKQKPPVNEVKVDNHPHRNNKTFGIVVTIVVALVLAGVAVFVYVSTQDNTMKSNNTESSTNVPDVRFELPDSNSNGLQEESVNPGLSEDIGQDLNSPTLDSTNTSPSDSTNQPNDTADTPPAAPTLAQ